MLQAQQLLRQLEASGLRIVEREILADTAPDLLLGRRSCCFLRSAHVIDRQRRELMDRLQRALQSFEEVLLVLATASKSIKK